MEIISGNGTEAQNNVVSANAGMAIATVEGLTPKAGFETGKRGVVERKRIGTIE